MIGKEIEPMQFERPCKICVELKNEYFFLVIADTVDEDDEGKVLEFRNGDEVVARHIKAEIISLSTQDLMSNTDFAT